MTRNLFIVLLLPFLSLIFICKASAVPDGTGNDIFVGNVGIGSLNPGQTLDVHGTIRTTGGFIFPDGSTQISASSNSSNYWLNNASTNVGISTTYAVGIGTAFVGGTGEASFAVMNGNVGIGTWVPGQLLSVGSANNQFTVSSAGAIGAISATIGIGVPTIASITVTGNGVGGSVSPNGTYTYKGQDNYNSQGNYNYYQNVSGWCIWHGDSYWWIGSSLHGGYYWYISSLAPTPPLTSAGWTNYSGSTGSVTTSAAATSGLVIDSAGDMSSGGVLSVTGIGNSYIIGNFGIGNSSPGALLGVGGSNQFTVNTSGAVTNAGETVNGGITATGNVGIGSATPGQMLDVAGTIRMKNGSGGALIFADGTTQSTAVTASTNYWNYSASGNIGISTTQAVGIGTTFIGGTGEGALSVMNGNVGIGTWVPGSSFLAINAGGPASTYSGISITGAGVSNFNGLYNSLVVPAWNGAYGVNNSISASGYYGGSMYGTYNSLSDFSGDGHILTEYGTYTTMEVRGSVNHIAYGEYINNSGSSSPSIDYGLYVDLTQGSGTTNYPAILLGGNVGIGSVSPGAVLDVHGTIRSTTGGFIFPDGSTQTSAASANSNFWQNDTAGNVGISTTYAVGIGTSFVGGTGEAAFAVMNGNVGIGTWVPGQILDVKGPARMTGFNLNSSTGAGYVLTDVSGTGTGTWQAASTGTNYWSLYGQAGNVGISTTNTVGIGTTSAGAGAGLVVMNGNVGIGTSSPASALNVIGDVNIGANQSLKLTGGTTFPASPSAGQMFYRTDNKQLYVYENGQWQSDRSTATFIVSASNSSNNNKADYVGNGTADDVAINAAITALPATGGIIYLIDGTYNITAPIVIGESNVTLTGAGWNTILKKMWNETTANNSGVITMGNSSTSYSGITVENLQVNGNKATYSGVDNNGILMTYLTYSTISNVWVNNAGGIGIAGNGSYIGSKNNILYSTVSSNGSDGINMGGDSNESIIGNKVASNGGSGIYSGTYGGAIVSNNTVTSNTNSGILFNLSYNMIIGNYVASNGGGIDGTTNTSDDFISDNVVVSNTSNGINFNYSGNNEITGNIVDSNTHHGISASYDTDDIISNNKIKNNGSGYNGIDISNDVSQQITNNYITNTAGAGHAIQIYGGSTGTYLSGNIYSGTGATAISDTGTGTIYAGQTVGSNYVFQGLGNLGIGSLTPGQVLDVQGTVRATAFVGNGSGLTGVGGSNYWLNTAAAGNVGISTTNTVGIGTTSGVGAGLVVMNGNVGIGTWTPSALLNVNGATTISGTTTISKDGGLSWGSSAVLTVGPSTWDGSSTGASLFVYTGSAVYAYPTGFGVDGSGTQSGGLNDSVVNLKAYGYQYGGDSSDLAFWTSNGGSIFERMRIDGNGNLGIGTTIPQGAFVVTNGNVGIGTSTPQGAFVVTNGNVGIGTWAPQVPLQISGTGQLAIYGDSSYNTEWISYRNSVYGSDFGFSSSGTLIGNGTNGAFLLRAGGNKGFAIAVNNSSAFNSVTNPQFAIDQYGNVGISSIAPGQALDVNGTVRATGFTAGAGGITLGGVNNTAWPSSSGSNYWLNTAAAGNVGISTTNTVGIGTTSGVGAGLVVMNGNVGIGTWAPQFTTDIHGNLGVGTVIPGGNFLVTSSGNVGIGTVVTSSALSVKGDYNGYDPNGILSWKSFTATGNERAITVQAPDMSSGVYSNVTIYTTGTNNYTNEVAGIQIGNSSLGSALVGGIYVNPEGGAPNGDGSLPGETVIFGKAGTSIIDVSTNGAPIRFVRAGGYSVNTKESARIDANGNVGIGSAYPGQLLDVQGTVRVLGNGKVGIGTSYPSGSLDVGPTGTICLGGTCNSTWPSSGSNYWLNNGSGASNVGISTTYAVGIGTTFVGGTGESALTVMNGNVGIGTWVPASILQVNSGGAPAMSVGLDPAGFGVTGVITPGVYVTNIIRTPQIASLNYGTLTFGISSYAPNPYLFNGTGQASDGTANVTWLTMNGNTAGYLGSYTSNNMTTGSVNAVALSNSFNAPTSTYNSSTAPMIELKINPTFNVSTSSTTGYTEIYSKPIETSISSTAANYFIQHYASGASTPNFSVTESGNVGIGTISPTGALQVVGSGNAIAVPSCTLGVGQAMCWGTGGCLGYCTAGTYPACSTCICC